MDEEDDVLSLMQIKFNLESSLKEQVDQPSFTIAILSNDDVRARTMLSTILNNPPPFYPRTKLKLIEHKCYKRAEGACNISDRHPCEVME